LIFSMGKSVDTITHQSPVSITVYWDSCAVNVRSLQ